MAAVVLLVVGSNAGAEQFTLDIKPQATDGALFELAEATEVQILFSPRATQNTRSSGVQGLHSLRTALAATLAGTGLVHKFKSDDLVVVRGKSKSAEGVSGQPSDEARRNGVQLAQLQASAQDSLGDGDSTAEEQEADAADTTATSEQEEALELVPQTVTGTRLLGGDPSAQVYSFSAEEISRRGVSNLEEFFRKMPWAFPSISTQSYDSANEVNRGTGPDFDAQLFGRELGVSTVNLRGMGSANTLVLMNGRRIAGTGGQEADFVNLLNIPLSAIERVDIQLGGASAVYGSDAIGGVVNFITKRNFRGLSASYRHELSSTDAHSTRASVTGGYAWDSGNATLVLSRSTTEPIVNAKTGFSSRDQRSIFGPESGFDGRDIQTGQPGIVCEMVKIPPPAWDPGRPPSYRCPTFTGPYFQLPPGHSGEGATVDDFVTFNVSYFPDLTGSPWPLDQISPRNGLDSTNTSLLLNVEQYVGDNLRVYADVNWSFDESFQEQERLTGNPVVVPASNAWNPFGKHVLVRYAPIYEAENGLMPGPYDAAENEIRTVGAGFIWSFDAFGANQELQFDVNRTKSWRETSSFQPWPERTRFDPTAEAFYAALSSPDPNIALNFFGDGTAQGSAFDEFLTRTRGPFEGVNETREYEVTLRGQLFETWAGPIVYSVGSEFRQTIIHSQGNSYSNFEFVDNPGAQNWFGGSLSNVGVERPQRDTRSWYAEAALPLVSPEMDLPGVHSLYLTMQARRDTNEAEGSLGGQESPRVPIRWWYWDPDDGFQYTETTWPLRRVNPNLHTAEFGRTSPRVGIQYNPVPEFNVRLSWQRNYRSPTWTNQFGSREPSSYPFACFPIACVDPFDPDGPTEIDRFSGVMQHSLNYAPEIREEHSDNYSASFDWAVSAVPGLRWRVEWEKADFTDRIEAATGYAYDPDTFALIIENPQIAVRNERGDLVGVNLLEFNVSEALNEMVSTRLEYSFDSPLGSFTPRVRYTRYLEDFTRIAPGQPPISVLGTQKGNDIYRLEGSLTWMWNRFAADLFVYYKPGYPQDGPYCQPGDVAPGARCTEAYVPIEIQVSSLTTVDLTVTYEMDRGLKIRGGGRNILDREAPHAFFFGEAPYDPGRWDARGQVMFLELTWDMDFGD